MRLNLAWMEIIGRSCFFWCFSDCWKEKVLIGEVLTGRVSAAPPGVYFHFTAVGREITAFGIKPPGDSEWPPNLTLCPLVFSCTDSETEQYIKMFPVVFLSPSYCVISMMANMLAVIGLLKIHSHVNRWGHKAGNTITSQQFLQRLMKLSHRIISFTAGYPFFKWLNVPAHME